MNGTGRARRVLAVASAGGHWVQLIRMAPAWEGCAVTYLTTDPGYAPGLAAEAAAAGRPPPGYITVIEASRWEKLRLIRQMLQIGLALLRLRPDAVISTGAAPGYFALRLGRLMGARTIWVDSIANAQEMSLSGLRAGPHADLWLTQWPHLAAPEGARGPRYRGTVL